MTSYRARKTLIAIHRYVGLTVGLLIVVTGLSGSVAIVWHEVTQLSDRRFNVDEPGTVHAPLQKIMDSLHAAHPQRKGAWAVDFPFPEDRHAPAWAVYESPEERAGHYESPLYVAVNPYTGELMGQFYWGSTPVSWIYNLHTMLQLDAAGEQIVGVVGIAFLLLALSGLWLWWPIGRFSRQQFATIPGAKGGRYEFHLHKLFGFYSSLVLLLVAVTGIVIVWPAAAAGAAGAVQPLNEPTIEQYAMPTVARVGAAPAIPFDDTLSTALKLFPDAELRQAFMPSRGGAQAYGVAVWRKDAERYNRMYPETRVWVNQYSGEVLKVMDAAQFNASRAMVGYNRYTFHSGAAFGAAGSTVMFIAGLLPAFFYYTGIRQWLRVRRRHGQSTKPVPPEVT